MNDRTIEHEADVRAVIQEEIETSGSSLIPDPSDGYVLLDENQTFNATWNHAEVEARYQDVAVNLNAVMNLLAANGLMIVFE